jgi:hypothetical protein
MKPLDNTYEITVHPVLDGKKNIDTVTGEVNDGFETLFSRYQRQSAARTLCRGERVCTCMRVRRKDQKEISVMQRQDSRTYYAGLGVCGSVWVCPVCAAKISERRRAELVAAVDTWKDRGGHLAFLTLTVKHTPHSKPFELLEKLMQMVDRLKSGRNRLAVLVPGLVGSIRALEVTHGAHGWHPHLHILLFCESAVDLREIRDRLWVQWSKLHHEFGLGRASKEAFGLQDGEHAAKYASKWGIPEEMTKGQFKTAKSKAGRTPFSLLDDYLKGDKQAGALFVEFAKTFKGRRQLWWSKGLRSHLGLQQEKTDEQLAQSVEAEDRKLAGITDKQWAVILRHELRAVVLGLFRSGASLEEFNNFILMYQNLRL